MFIKTCAFLCASVKVLSSCHTMWHQIKSLGGRGERRKKKFGWPALLLIRNSYGMSAGDIQVCGTSRRSIRWLLLAQDRAALLGILVLSAFSLHSNPAIYTVRSIKSRKHDSLGWHTEADIFFVLKTEEAECACSLPVTDFTYSPAWKEEHSGEKPEPVLNNCREIWLGLFITSSKWYKDFIPMSCEDGWIKGPEMKGKKKGPHPVKQGRSCQSRNQNKKRLSTDV